MKIKIQSRGCPVCGFPDFEALDAIGSPTWEICPSCGCESGYEYQEEEDEGRLVELRRQWFVDEGSVWWSSSRKAPSTWNAKLQLEAAGFTVPPLEKKAPNQSSQPTSLKRRG
jgi:hypothetical protein